MEYHPAWLNTLKSMKSTLLVDLAEAATGRDHTPKDEPDRVCCRFLTLAGSNQLRNIVLKTTTVKIARPAINHKVRVA